MTRKQYLRILIALIGVAGLGIAAKSQEADKIVVSMPYEFVVVGKTLSAGTYGVSGGPIYNAPTLPLRSLSSSKHEVDIEIEPTRARNFRRFSSAPPDSDFDSVA
jgi:hypothetical protein